LCEEKSGNPVDGCNAAQWMQHESTLQDCQIFDIQILGVKQHVLFGNTEACSQNNLKA
jgi:hypothetical protein